MQRTRKLAFLMAALAAASMVLTACGPKAAPADNKAPATGTTQTAAKKPAVGGQLIMKLDKDPDNFNPILSSTSYGSAIYSQVYDSLFDYNDKWEPIGRLAESWTFTNNNLTMTIKLRQGIKFHDGTDFTADDVVFTYMSIMDKEYTGPRASNVKLIKEIKAVDKNTVQVDLKEPNAAIFSNLNLAILSKKQFESTPVKDFDKNPTTMKPMGTGPYKFVEYVKGQYVKLVRNENWYLSQANGGAPFIQDLLFKVIPESATAEAALENGEVDVLTPDPKDVSRLEKDFKDKISLYDWERNGFGYITLNVTRPGLNDKVVRQALTYGLNRQSIIDGVMEGRGVIPPGPIPPVSWAYDSSIKPYAYDAAKAKQMLEQAGYKLNAQGIYEKNGQPLKFVFYASSGSSLIEGITAIAKKNWKDIGIDVDVQLIDFNAMMDNYLKPGKFDMSFSGFSLSLDPDQTALFHSTQVNGFNRGRYNSADVDKLLENGVRELDPAKRKAIYSDYQKKLVDDAPIIMVYANKYTDAVAKKVKGGVRNMPGVGVTDVYKWWITEK
jgi:peptide/nickel transport system substrate-binding protein